MMKRSIRSVALVLLVLFAVQAAAFADAIEGRVQQAAYNGVDVVVYDAEGRPYPHAIHLAVDGATQLSGVRSATQLQPQHTGPRPAGKH